MEIMELRKILLSCALSEELKWGVPCYIFDQRNIVIIHKFKAYCALLFFKGALLKDSHQILIQQTKNVQAARQVRFTNIAQVRKLKPVIKEYIHEAIDVERAGIKVPIKKTSEYEVPQEFQKEIDKDGKLKKAFKQLSPGRQRGYLLYFSSAKQSGTRESRIKKYIPYIMKGKGLNDEFEKSK
ncbi:MAG: YdeI/OmpD-associated family protein [Ginsengibacter sp.]